MDQLNPMLQQFLGSFARWLLAGAAVWAVQHGIFTENEAAKYVEAGSLALVGIGWSLYQKYGSRLKLVTAMSSDQSMTEKELEIHIARAQAIGASLPSVTTPKTEAPQAIGSVVDA
jgi:hypothetical protein